MFADRKTLLKTHKDGRLVMEIERKKGDSDSKEPEGWLAKKTKWVRVFDVIVSDKKDDDLGTTEYDNLVRALTTSADQFIGWMIFDERRVWINHPGQNVKMHLQSKGLAKDAAETVMGTRSARVGDWWASPSGKSTPAAGSGTKTPPNSFTSPPPWNPTKRRTIRTGT